MLKNIVENWSSKFVEKKFPILFYYACIDRLNSEQNPEILKDYISYLLYWKDGKVRQDPLGDVVIDDVHYTLSSTKPNTYSENRHATILAGQEFFQWAQFVRNTAIFSPDYVLEICNKFNLWSNNSIVLPTYLLHILNPRVFPIFDQHVNRARKFLMGADFDLYRNSPDFDDYKKYGVFWKDFAKSLNIDLGQANLAEIKKIDNALWSMGKFISSHIIPESNQLKSTEPTVTCPKEAATRHLTDKATLKHYYTNSPEFKNLVFSYCQKMNQVKAIQEAASELGVILPSSYLQYPGSHIHRWRKQGFPK